MKKIKTLWLLCAFVGNAYAQKPKPAKEKLPTAAEMKAMIKETQAELDKLDPETKRMMDSMGIKIPSITEKQIKDVGKISDKQIADAYEDAERIVPKKDVVKIAKANAIKLNATNINAYLQALNNSIGTKMNSNQKKDCDDIFAFIQTKKNTANSIALNASGLFASKQILQSLFIMGKACLMDNENIDNLNNYASFLTMSGGAEFAIPLLNKINKDLPNSYTILNNLGQAWFCIGAIDIAEKNLNACLIINNNHPQANETMSAIAESKSNIAKAKELLKKSIKTTYSQEKELKLEKMGEKLTKNDINWYYPKKDDGLGLGNIQLPKWPKNIGEVEAEGGNWIIFFHQVKDTEDKLKKEEIENVKMLEVQMKKNMEEVVRKKNVRLSTNIYARKAFIALKEYANSYEKAFTEIPKKMIIGNQEVHKLKEKYLAKFKAINKLYDPQYGEGMANPEAEECAANKDALNSYLSEVNSVKEKYFTEAFREIKILMNDYLYYITYTANSQLEFDMLKIQTKNGALGSFVVHIPFEDKIDHYTGSSLEGAQIASDMGMVDLVTMSCKNEIEIEKGKAAPINFLEADCPEIVYEFGIYTITEKCGKMKGDFSLGPLKINLEGDAYTDQFISKGSMEVSLTGIKDLVTDIGKLKALELINVNAKKPFASVLIEFDNNGITDIGIKAGVKADIGPKALPGGFDPKIKGSLEGKLTWNTGLTLSTGGIIKGLSVNFK